jgi:hypoxanthine-DNA glycosylase
LLQMNLANPAPSQTPSIAPSTEPLNEPSIRPSHAAPHEPPTDYATRLQRLHGWGVGLWDVYASCLRAGSLDSAIREPQLNDFVALARSLPHLAGIAFNGGESWKHHRLVQAQLDLPMWRLPSSSPAHASWTVQRKAEAWRAVLVQAGLVAGP